jgi:hypothetical protein
LRQWRVDLVMPLLAIISVRDVLPANAL